MRLPILLRPGMVQSKPSWPASLKGDSMSHPEKQAKESARKHGLDVRQGQDDMIVCRSAPSISRPGATQG